MRYGHKDASEECGAEQHSEQRAGEGGIAAWLGRETCQAMPYE